jgi:short-subunit dehydrogenase
MSRSNPKALVTCASCAVGLTYADRLARRGYDLLLLASAGDRPSSLARTLRAENGVEVNVMVGDISTNRYLDEVDALLNKGAGFDVVLNSLGLQPGKSLAEERPTELDRQIAMNIRAYARISAASSRSMARRRRGAIINVTSAIGLAPELVAGANGASKAFVMALTRSMQNELSPHGVYVQLVLAAATRTDVWSPPNCELETLPGMMTVADLVDAALVGFDRSEAVTIPSLADTRRLKSFDRARTQLLDDLVNSEPARRYRASK